MHIFSFSYTQTHHLSKVPCACWSGKRSAILLQTVAEYKHEQVLAVYLTGPSSTQNGYLLNHLLAWPQATEIKVASSLSSLTVKIMRQKGSLSPHCKRQLLGVCRVIPNSLTWHLLVCEDQAHTRLHVKTWGVTSATKDSLELDEWPAQCTCFVCHTSLPLSCFWKLR